MSFMVGQSWCASFAPRSPTVSQILYDLKKKQFEAPIFVCLHCAKETHSQYAMAAHCRQHVRAGMGKGTVGHIKYYPDHTFIFLGNNAQPSPPRAPGSTAQQDLARSSWLQSNGSHQNIIHTSNLHANHATLQPLNYNQVGGLSSLFPYVNLLSCSANGVGSSTTPASVQLEIDLTLRLGPPTPRPTTEVCTPGIYYPFQVGRYF